MNPNNQPGSEPSLSPAAPSANPSSSLPTTPPATPNPLNTQSNITSASSTPSSPSKAKTGKLLSKWYFWVIVALSCVAIFAITLSAIYMSEHASAEEKISQLEKEIKEKDQLLAKYGAQLGQIVDDSSRPGYDGNKDDDNSTSDIDTADYVYVGEWGIKFKIPEGLKNVSYRFANKINQDADPDAYPYDVTKTLCVSATLDEMDYTPDSFSILESSFGCLIQAKETDIDQFVPEEIVRIGDSVFRYKYPTGITPIGDNEQEQAWSIKATDLIKQMLTDSNNVSTF